MVAGSGTADATAAGRASGEPGAADERPSRRMRDARVQMTEIVMPNDTNPHGTLSGGRVMQLVDIAAAVAAVRHARRGVVTAAFDEVIFLAPVPLGHIIMLDAQVTCVGRTSMEVKVIVRGENPPHRRAPAYDNRLRDIRWPRRRRTSDHGASPGRGFTRGTSDDGSCQRASLRAPGTSARVATSQGVRSQPAAAASAASSAAATGLITTT